MKKIFCGILVAFLLFGSLNYSVWAAEDSNIYEETRNQISLDYLVISVTDGKSLHYTLRPKLLTRNKAEREKKKLDLLLEKIPNYEQLLIDAMNHNLPIHTISVVDVPLEFKEDHYERVRKENNSLLHILLSPLFLTANAADSNTGAESNRGNFVMAMSVSKVFNKQEQRYKYMTITTGQWKAHSVRGTSNYPAMGEDLVAVTSPLGTIMDTSSLSASYSNYRGKSRAGKDTGNNPDFWKEDSNDNYCAYAIKEDPLGTYQLDYFSAVTTFFGGNSSITRKAVSKYVHSWSSVQFEIEINIPMSSQEVTTLTIIPNHIERTWECACDVVFNF